MIEDESLTARLFIVGGHLQTNNSPDMKGKPRFGLMDILVLSIPHHSLRGEKVFPSRVQMEYKRVSPYVFSHQNQLYILGGCDPNDPTGESGNSVAEVLELDSIPDSS